MTQPDHERIWLQPRPPFGVADDRTWCQHDVWTGEPDYEGDPPTEYVRADIAAAAIRTLERLGYTHCGGEFWKPPLGAGLCASVERCANCV